MSATVEIPKHAFVPCPKVDFKNVRVAESCPNCPHFKGMVRVTDHPKATFIAGHRVGCAHPVTRAMIHVEA